MALKRTWVFIWIVYLAFLEILSWAPVPKSAACFVEEAHASQAVDHNQSKYCPAFHVGLEVLLDKADKFLEVHDKSVIGGFTIVLAISTIGLWFATVKLATEARDTARLQADDTRILQRAYIAVEPAGMQTYRSTGNMVGHFLIKNAGRLPAKNLTWFASAREEDDDEWVTDFPIGDLYGNTILAAGAYMTHGSGQIAIPTRKCVYVWGMVRYDDGFGKTRYTKFCHRYPRAMMQVGGSGGHEIFAQYGRYHGFGNSTDES